MRPQVPVAPVQSSYNKDDFFDQLSCDTLERLAISDEGEEWSGHLALAHSAGAQGTAPRP